MGMSASQARLIALTERMNDIEYQGQQINQQRTTLSSQVNALYNTLLEMDVPTPPSTIDYQKVVYSGVTGATRFTMSNVIPTGKNASGNNTYSIDMAYQMSGHSVSKASTSVNVSAASEFLYYKEVDQSVYRTTTSEKRFTMNTTPLKELPNASTDDASADDILVKMTVADYKKLGDDVTSLFQNTFTGNDTNKLKDTKKSIEGLDDDDIIYVQCNSSNVKSSGKLAEICGLTLGTDEEGNQTVTGELHNVYSGKLTETSEEVYSGYKTKDQIIANNLYIIENGSAKQITSREDLIDYINQNKKIVTLCDEKEWIGDNELKVDNPTYNQDANGTGLTVGKMALYNMGDQDIITKLGSASYKDYLEALRNSFPEFEGLSDKDLEDKFYVYIETKSSGSQVPHFIKKDDVGALNKEYQSAITYDYDEDGTYTKKKKEDDCELEFDASTGRIARVGIPDGNGQVIWIKLEAATETDDEAYQAAFNDYEYDKIKYDKAQQEINLKTSIIQAEDKSLELKLTRLDNERNAVNTEIEAVKKVVNDNIEKSFKTFSG